MQKPWHSLPVAKALDALGSAESGLPSPEATARLSTYGPNQLAVAPTVPVLKLLLDEFRSPLVLVLIAAAGVLVGVGQIAGDSDHLIDAVLIALIVVLNACLGFSQNYRASRGIESMSRLSAPSAKVLRDGVAERLDAVVLVPGDVVLLEEGSRVPADGRVISSIDMSIDESALTGESLPVRKQTGPVPENASLADRTSMAYSGTVVMRGRGRMLVTRTGMQTEVGKIAEDVQQVDEEPTVFQREIGRLATRIGWAVGVLIAIVAILQLLAGDLSLLETFITAVALAVAAVPEGLPVVLTLALAFGTRKMLARKTQVRSLPVVEIVGAAEVICTDKTGTVTEGRMSVRMAATSHGETDLGEIAPDSLEEPLQVSALIAGLCNNAQRHPELGYVGDPTETALLEFADRSGVPRESYERTGEVPFSSERRMMSVSVKVPAEEGNLLLDEGRAGSDSPSVHPHPDRRGGSAADRRGTRRPAAEKPGPGRPGAPGSCLRLQGGSSKRPDERGRAHLRIIGCDDRSAKTGSGQGH